MEVPASWFPLFVMCLWIAVCHTTKAPTTLRPLGDLEAELTKRGGFKQFLNLLELDGLLDELKDADNITVFATTDAAFASLPSNQLLVLQNNPLELQKVMGYHTLLRDVKRMQRTQVNLLDDNVIRSSNNLSIRINAYALAPKTITVQGVNITERSIPVSNGYVHALGGIMTPPEGDVVDILTADGGFTTFLSQVTAVNLVDLIKSETHMTIFAPNDLAFAKLDPKILTYLTSNPTDLGNLLLHHMITRRTRYSICLHHQFTFISADEGHDKLMIFQDFATGQLKINTATIVQRDISATNGVIHVIEGVLIPIRVLLKIEESGITLG